jgi:hypothetical protein
VTPDLRDLLTDENLRRLIARKPIGEDPPWREAFAPKGRGRLVAVVDRLRSRDSLVVDAEPPAYGSGYASFADFFVHPANGSTTTMRGDRWDIRGVRLWLAFYAPIALYGAAEVTRSARGGGAFGFLDPSEARPPEPALRFVEAAVLDALARAGMHVLPRGLAREPVPFDAPIATNFAKPPYRVFDAIFHWRD